MTYIATKTTKNKGIATLLIFLFGPLGMFYSTIAGALVMMFLAPVLFFVGFLFTGAWLQSFGTTFLFMIFLYYLTCIFWGLVAVEKYNRGIIENSLNADYHSYPHLPKESSLNDLHRDLNSLEALYNQNIITEENYTNQKSAIMEKINQLNAPVQTNETYYPPLQESKRNNKIWGFVLVGLIVIILLYIMYDKKTNSFRLDNMSTIFSRHQKDKEEIKNQIEKAYFGLTNGAYTSQTIQGGSDGLPFYNQNLGSVMAMGLMPLANLFGKMEVKPENINIYEFIDDDKAKVKYDLHLITETFDDSTEIDMIAKKVGGYWKLDADKFFGKSETRKRHNKNTILKQKNVLFEEPNFPFSKEYSGFEQLLYIKRVKELLSGAADIKTDGHVDHLIINGLFNEADHGIELNFLDEYRVIIYKFKGKYYPKQNFALKGIFYNLKDNTNKEMSYNESEEVD
jgi:hypothetical protein